MICQGRAEMEAEVMKSELAAIAAEEAKLAARKAGLKKWPVPSTLLESRLAKR